MEDLVIPLEHAFRGRRVFLTGHTGFKGSWLLLWLRQLGAKVTGYALPAPAQSMYTRLELDGSCQSVIDDIRDRDRLGAALETTHPDFIFHLAAQSLVLDSYDDPLGTIQTNIGGTANLLDAVRTIGRPCVVVIVTSDKCYENSGWVYSYRESDPLGGHDVYSMSKAAAELVTASYRRSFFNAQSGVRVASARAGNVIGGGDWANNRLVPDCIRALRRGETIAVRNPRSIRPWQHVLEPLGGYLYLAASMTSGHDHGEAWNFGPSPDDARTVEELVTSIVKAWGTGDWVVSSGEQPHEAGVLRLSTDKARANLGWRPVWAIDAAIARTVAWYKADAAGSDPASLRTFTADQIENYSREAQHGS